MATTFMSLPMELHVLVFTKLSNLDEALSLAETSKYLFRVYISHKRDIRRQIIMLSDVYEFDLCLSKLLAAVSDLGQRYRRLGSELEAEERPEEKVFLDCINSQWVHETSPDKAVDDIDLRWQRTRILRELYLDDKVHTEYNQFRKAFVSASNPLATVAIAEPGFTLPRSRQHQPTSFGEDFHGRFHRALCMHSMAIASYRLAKATCRSVVLSEPDIDECTHEFWDKTSFVVGGKKITPTVQDKLDCIEVFDFLYMFSLRKLLPIGKADYWTRDSWEEWLFQGYCYPNLSNLETWFGLLSTCRNCLLPLDLVDLLSYQAWRPDTKYPPNVALYLTIRGAFDRGEDIDSDRYTFYQRRSMVSNLTSDGPAVPYEGWDAEVSCWWDVSRLKCGSPFQPGFQWKHLGKAEAAENSTIQRNEQHAWWPGQGLLRRTPVIHP